MGGGGTTSDLWISTNRVDDDNWYHLVMNFDGDIELYLNNALNGSEINEGTTTTNYQKF